MSSNPSNLTADQLVLTPADAKKLTPAAAKLTYADLQSLEAAFADMGDNRSPNAAGDPACCCCCCTAVSQVSA